MRKFPRLRIGLNATAAVTGGGLTYWLSLLPALARLGRPHDYIVYASAGQRRLVLDLPDNFSIQRIRFAAPAPLSRPVWEQVRFPGVLKRDRIDVLLAAADVAPLRAPCPVVLAVRNPGPYYGSQSRALRERLRNWTLRRLSKASGRRVAHVFFVSEDSRRRIAPLLGLPDAKTSVVYHGLAHSFFANPREEGGEVASGPAAPAMDAPRPYILSVSALYPHKDFATLLRAFGALLGDSDRHRDLRLIIAGARVDPAHYESLLRIVAELRIQPSVEFCGEVPYTALPDLYRGASLFALSSLAETFGHPLLEAMASGLPVIVTDMDVTREICAEAAEYFPPGDWRALATGMDRLLSDRAARTRHVVAGLERAALFSWDQCAAITLELLESAALGNDGRKSAAPKAGVPSQDGLDGMTGQ